MNKEAVKEILYILIAITLGVFVVKFLIWLLPVILIGLCSYYIYKSIKKNRKDENKHKTKKKPVKIIDMVSDED